MAASVTENIISIYQQVIESSMSQIDFTFFFFLII